MKRTHFFITIVCIVHVINAMEQDKRHNTKGIIPLFDESDTKGIERFNRMHRAVIDETKLQAHAITSYDDVFTENIKLIQHDLKLLRNRSKALGPEQYLAILKQQHEKKKEEAIATAREEGEIVSALETLIRKQDKRHSSSSSYDDYSNDHYDPNARYSSTASTEYSE